MGETREKKEECNCPYCDADIEIKEEAPFCVPCDIIVTECIHCGEPVREGVDVCPHCGEATA